MKKMFSIVMAMAICLTLNAMPASAAEVNAVNETAPVSWEDFVTVESNIEGVTFTLDSLEIVPVSDSSRAVTSAGNTRFRTFGTGTLTVRANTPLTSIQAFARLANGGAENGSYISVEGPGMVNLSVPVSEQYYNVPSSQFTGIPARAEMKQYQVQFYAPYGSSQFYGISLFFS